VRLGQGFVESDELLAPDTHEQDEARPQHCSAGWHARHRTSVYGRMRSSLNCTEQS
jgi:hypothetical protein